MVIYYFYYFIISKINTWKQFTWLHLYYLLVKLSIQKFDQIEFSIHFLNRSKILDCVTLCILKFSLLARNANGWSKLYHMVATFQPVVPYRRGKIREFSCNRTRGVHAVNRLNNQVPTAINSWQKILIFFVSKISIFFLFRKFRFSLKISIFVENFDFC